MRSEYKVAGRLLDLIDLIDRGQPLRLADIVANYGVDPQCARDYRDFVGRRRNLVEGREGRTKVWRGEGDTDASVARAAALDFAVHALSELEGSEHLAELDALAHRARNALGDVECMQLDRATRNFQVRTPGRTRNPDRGKWTKKLLGALHQRHICRIHYEGLNGFVGRLEIEPWGMLLHHGRPICVAGKRTVDGARPVRRMYLLDGIGSVTVTQQRFREPPAKHTDFTKIFRDYFGIYCDLDQDPEDVTLRVTGAHATAMRHRSIHSSQQVTERADGTTEVRLRLVLCPEFIAFVLSLLPDIHIVGPPALHDRVEAVTRKWLDRSSSER